MTRKREKTSTPQDHPKDIQIDSIKVEPRSSKISQNTKG